MKYALCFFLPLLLLSMNGLSQALPSGNMQIFTLRLSPGEDLKNQLDEFVNKNRIEAGFLLSCVGSLTQVQLRLANQESGTSFKGHFEIVSLVGTLSIHGSHLHMSVSDSTGKTTGGHLLDQNKVYTTAEIVIGVLPDIVYQREPDPVSGYKELKVYRKKRK